MIDINSFFMILIYILGSILLVVLIVLGIKLINTVTKVDKLLDETHSKIKSLDRMFSVVDVITDSMAIISDKIGKLLLGIGIGAGLGVLFAPKSGRETRQDLKKEIDKFISNLKEIDVNEVKDEFLNKIEDIRNELEDLDKEKVVSIAKEKGKAIKKKTDELVELAKEKGTPIIQSSADAIRQKAIEATKSVLNKLEAK